MWVINGTGDSVSKITTGSLATSVTTFNAGTGDAPNSIAFDGTNLWASDSGSDRVQRLRTS